MNDKFNKELIERCMSVIDTKEKAYILGYALAVGCISNSMLFFRVPISCRKAVHFVLSNLGGGSEIFEHCQGAGKEHYMYYNGHTSNKQIVSDIGRHCQYKKKEKTFPRIAKNLEHYMLLGYFDGAGSLVWGHRKDRNRIWHRVCLAGAYKTLLAVQRLLVKEGVTSSLYQKQDEKRYVLEVTSRNDVFTLLKYMYGNEDLIVLYQHYEKYNALRLELGEFGEDQRTPSQAHGEPREGVETTGGENGPLNNQE